MSLDVNPWIAYVGPFSLTWQGIFIGVGIVAALALASRHLESSGLNPDLASELAIFVVIPAILGARLFHVFDTWAFYAVHPLEVFEVTRGGAAIYGAIIVGTGAALAFARLRHVPISTFLDALAPAQVLGLATGRIGDLLTGASLARPSTLPIAITYVNPASFDQHHAPVHPVAAYEIIWDLAILLLILRIRRARLPRGVSFWTFTALYGAGQIWTGFFRDEPVDLYGMGQAQIIGLFCLVVGVIALLSIGTEAARISRQRRRAELLDRTIEGDASPHRAGSSGMSQEPRPSPLDH